MRFPLVLAFVLALSCASPVVAPVDREAIENGVQEMIQVITQDLAAGGPNRWMDHFLDDEAFFMASDGRMLFPGFDSARVFIAGFAPGVATIDLRLHNLRIDVLSAEQAVLAADYTEVITDTAGVDVPLRGYLTGLAQLTDEGWKLRHAHWSSPALAPE